MLARCQREPFLRVLKTKVVSCERWSQSVPVVAAESSGKGKKKGKGKKGKKKNEEKKGDDELYEVELEDTILFPEGGGQPTDYGTIDDVPISYVCRTPKTGRILHRSPKPLAPEQEVSVKVDFSRRFDHMQHHSAQHLISAVARRDFGFNTMGWWLATHPSECSIELDTDAISKEQLATIEATANEVIRNALTMRVHVFNNEVEVQGFADIDEATSKKSLPENGEPLRVVEIPNLEFNTCCGTHVTSTSQIQAVKLTSAQRGKGGHTKLNFLAGDRVMLFLARAHEAQAALTSVLDAGVDQHVTLVEKMRQDGRDSRSREKRLLQQIATLEGKRLANEATDADCKVVHFHHEVNSQIFTSAIPELVHSANANTLIFMTFGGEKGDGAFHLVGPAPSVDKVGKLVATALDGRGGGRPGSGRMQGVAKKIENRSKALDVIRGEI